MTRSETAGPAPLTGLSLLGAALAIGMSNFLVVLDTTIANVSIPTISGSLGVSVTQGTWVITAYAVAEAITVPLTGWLAKRFGAKRVFLVCYAAFGALSLLCGLASSFGLLVAGRVLLGLAGGPLMPLSLMLLIQVFPRDKAMLANVIWAMTTLIAPVLGPILGGIISDSAGWPWIFHLKVPLAALGVTVAWLMLRDMPDRREKAAIDFVGLGLLVVWVGAFQVMLDEGRNLDWFASAEIVALAVVAAVGFAAFLIWELTHDQPIVDLRIFRSRGFAAAAVTYTVGFGAFFASVVLLPLWLQQNMGYTATWAGYATGVMGLLAIGCAPIVGKILEKVDARAVIFTGLTGLGLLHVWRMGFTPDVTFLQMAAPTLLSGVFMVMFFIPVSGLAIASVEPHETANAAGLSNFMRTLGGAIATAVIQTGWSNAARIDQTELAGALVNGERVVGEMTASGMSRESAVISLTRIVEGQSLMLGALDMFAAIAVVFVAAGALIWVAPRPRGPIDTTGGH
ncbi:DHA2 family efflux MFS transporter permease subunit [Phenylobacterium sp.]|uniref:DHA2 family efflux MFS transporter permease subunit n=1 Tax=Phenylobacterium sp. TaxID=1871053 RepID=UPI00393D2648